MERQAKYPQKIQVIRSQKQKPRPYVFIPIPLAAAMGIEGGEEVEWEVLDRGELHLVRLNPKHPRAKRRADPDAT
jgi:anaerobic selenocysteine-containing dehydrogenase